MKPFYQDCAITVYNGDCLSVMTDSIARQSVDLVFTSPPYFNARDYSRYFSYSDYLDFLTASLSLCHGVLKKDRPLIINVSCVIQARSSRQAESIRLPIPFDVLKIAQSLNFKFLDDIIWEKPDGASNRAIKFSHHRRPVAYKPFTVTEYLLVFKRDDGGLLDQVIRSHSIESIERSLVPNGYERTNVWKLNTARRNGHPAPFPAKLAENIIRYYSFIGDTVLDPFAGSGTTLAMAKTLERKAIGIEAEKGYCQYMATEFANKQGSSQI
jgi:DNA modification methylase